MIIGAGVVGASTAFWAARSGLRPVVLEARPAAASLTTPASTGAFRLQFDNQEETELVHESVELILNFTEITGQDSAPLMIRQPGYLWATTSVERAEEQRRLVSLQHSWGQTDIEILNGAEARERFPYLSPAVIQARYRGDDGFIEPRALTLGLLAASQAPLYTSCRVSSLRALASGGFLLETNRGPVQADRVVNAAGPFSGETGCHGGCGAAAGSEAASQDRGSGPGARSSRRADDHRRRHRRPLAPGVFGRIPLGRCSSRGRTENPLRMSPPTPGWSLEC